MLKAELHLHTADDPVDYIPHGTIEAIDRAADLGYHVLAVTLHERQLDLGPFQAHARVRGVVLIPGVERTIEGAHVLLLNFRDGADRVRTFDDLARLRARERGLVIAPHPFFPAPSCLGQRLDRHAGLFDAVELNYFHTRWFDFNARAVRWAQTRGKPVVANTDVHSLAQLGPTFTLVDAPPDPDAICEAVRHGRVSAHTEPISVAAAARHVVCLAEAFIRPSKSLAASAPVPFPAGAQTAP